MLIEFLHLNRTHIPPDSYYIKNCEGCFYALFYDELLDHVICNCHKTKKNNFKLRRVHMFYKAPIIITSIEFLSLNKIKTYTFYEIQNCKNCKHLKFLDLLTNYIICSCSNLKINDHIIYVSGCN